MKAMILAAGRGERMRPLTDRVPKPLLEAGGQPLIVRQIEGLVAAGIVDLVVNTAWLGDLLEAVLDDGSRFGARIAWSREGTALETGGGIVTALPLLAAGGSVDAPFIVVSADIVTDYDYRLLAPIAARVGQRHPAESAHLVLVDNPPWHSRGDMGLVDGRVVRADASRPAFTYANIGVFHPRVFDGLPAGRAMPLFPWAYALCDAGRVGGSRHAGAWHNVGTPAQLAALDERLAAERG